MKKVRKQINPFDAAIGWRIRTLRMSHKEAMLDLGDHIGVSYNQINKYEKGIDRISAENLHKISRHYNVPIGYFFGEGETPHCPKVHKISAEIENMPSDAIREGLYSLVRNINKTLGAVNDEAA
jgi:transcriptional regulator with XRE-family HTH domain